MINSKLAELFGIMVGDGCLSNTGKGKNSGNKYWIYICGHKVDDFNHQQYIKRLFLELFNKEVKICERKKENAIFIRFSDKNIFNKFIDLGYPCGEKYAKLNVPKWIKEDKENIASFIRGLFDTDGSVVLSKQNKDIPYYPRFEISTKSKILAEEVKALLNQLYINCSLSNKLQYFRLEVAGFENCERWLRLIGTNNPKHQAKYLKADRNL